MNAPIEFRAAMAAAGLDFSGEIIPDGQLHRVKVNGDRGPNSWYVLHPDGIAAGSFGCWKRDIRKNWCAKADDTLTEAERAERDRKWGEQQAARIADQRRQNDAARIKAQEILDAVEEQCNAAGVPCNKLTLTSDIIYEAIIEAATTSGCDLIFMASHGRRGLKSLLLGSETNKVLTHSKIPVLVYR